LAAEGWVRARGIGPGHPTRDDLAGMIEAAEQRLGQEVVAHPRIERRTDAVLHRLAGRDEVPGHTGLLAPARHRGRGEPGAVVADDRAGLAASGDARRRLPREAAARDGVVDPGGQTCPGGVVYHVEDPAPAAPDDPVVDEIDRPACVRRGRPQQRCPRSRRLRTSSASSR